jgi:hypothetical protein
MVNIDSERKNSVFDNCWQSYEIAAELVHCCSTYLSNKYFFSQESARRMRNVIRVYQTT